MYRLPTSALVESRRVGVEGLPIRGVPVPVEAGAHLQQLGQGGHRDGVEWTGQTFVLLMLKYLLIRLFHGPGKGFVVMNACNNVFMYVCMYMGAYNSGNTCMAAKVGEPLGFCDIRCAPSCQLRSIGFRAVSKSDALHLQRRT